MREAYTRYFEPCLIEVMKRECPDFQLVDADARRKIGKLVFYGSGKLTGFFWNAAPKLVFVIVFRVPNGKDSFEAACEWSDSGKIVKEHALLTDDLNDESVLRRSCARTHVQSLSQAAADPPGARVVFWGFWKPRADLDDVDQWFKETMEDEMRDLPDAEARERVEAAVNNAVSDVKRLVLPWFNKKLAVVS